MKKHLIVCMSVFFCLIIALLVGCHAKAEGDETEKGLRVNTESEVYLYPETDLPQGAPIGWDSVGVADNLRAEIYRGEVIWAESDTIGLVWRNSSPDKTYYTNGVFRIECWNGEKWVDCTPEGLEYDLSQTVIPPHPHWSVDTGREYDIGDFELAEDKIHRIITYYSTSEDGSDLKPMIVEFNYPREAPAFATCTASLIHSETSPHAGKSSSVTYYYFRDGYGSRHPEDDRTAYLEGTSPELDAFFERIYVNLDQTAAAEKRVLPLARIDSMEDISVLKSFNNYNLSWINLVKSFDEEFFKTKTIFVISYTESSISYYHRFDTPITVSDRGFSLELTYYHPSGNPNGSVLDACLDCSFLIVIDRADIEHCAQFEAWLVKAAY